MALRCFVSGRRVIAVIAAIVIVAGGVVWWWATHRGTKSVYSPEGFGGLKRADQLQRKSTSPVAPIVDACNHGKYRQAESAAQLLIDSNARSKDPAKRRQSVEARYVLAFSAAQSAQADFAHREPVEHHEPVEGRCRDFDASGLDGPPSGGPGQAQSDLSMPRG